MPTASLLVTDTSGWTTSLGANTTESQNTSVWTGNNADQFSTTGKNKSNNNFLQTSGTWESLFGIPTGQNVTLIGQPDNFDYQVVTFTTAAASTAGPLELRDSGQVLLLTLATGQAYSSTVARTTVTGTQQTVPAANQPGATTIFFRLNATQATGNSASAVNGLVMGHCQFTITYATATAPVASTGTPQLMLLGVAGSVG